MLGIFVAAIVVFVALLLLRPFRDWLIEEIKEGSDRLLLLFLFLTSRFGSELTDDGRREQRLWREQRLRNLRGLALRSRQRFEKLKS
jgi:hypothetical protein